MEISELTPKWSNQLKVKEFGKSDFLLSHLDLQQHILINKQTRHLLSYIDGKRNLYDIMLCFNEKDADGISLTIAYEIIYKKLGNFFSPEHVRRRNTTYLKLRFIFLPKEIVDKLSRYTSGLFKPPIFFSLLVLFLTISGIYVLLNYESLVNDYKLLFSPRIILYGAFFFASAVFHELGHIGAARSFGAIHGGIGFGFYLLTPVFYSDVTDIWRLPALQRIIVNHAGIFFDLFVSCILIIFHLFTNESYFLVLFVLLLIRVLINLNPFIKFDGYWILVDLTNTPNLHKKGLDAAKGYFRKGNLSFSSKRETFLVIYSVLSTTFILLFLTSLLLSDPYGIFYFPKLLYSCIANGDWSIDFSEIIIPATFWFLLFRFLWITLRGKVKFRKIKI